MEFSLLIDILPELAERETRSVTFFQDSNIPAGQYFFMESFCSIPGCDCRRAKVLIMKIKEGQPFEKLATIDYGWESLTFYQNWSPLNAVAHQMQGVHLDTWNSPPGDIPLFLLEFFKNVILSDPTYAVRIQSHYFQFKEALQQLYPDKEVIPVVKVGRNDPCPCGSGKKYKKCCG